jgi:hypothetical protein
MLLSAVSQGLKNSKEKFSIQFFVLARHLNPEFFLARSGGELFEFKEVGLK